MRRAWNILMSGVLLTAALSSRALMAQNIAEIAKSDPLLITGVIGTQNTYYHSSAGSSHSSPLSNSLYVNLNITAYGFSMPFSFTYFNSQTSFSYPTFSFNISPTYKDWTLHLGRRSMPFSSYIYNIPFNGAGIEYNGHNIRFGAFYGYLQKSVNDDPTDATARSPQYERIGWGLKLGYGGRRNYLDLFLFRSKDRFGSLDERWYGTVRPQENIAVGARGRIAWKQYLALSAHVSMSLFSDDTQSERLAIESLHNWDKVFDARYSSLYRFAGDVSLNLNLKKFNALVSYKMVQPDYKTLGSNYISNNIQSLGASVGTTLWHGRMSLMANGSVQEDNLSGKQLYTTRGLIYSANSSLQLWRNLSLSLSYNGYRQLQYDGTAVVNDTTRVNRLMHSFTAAPTYMFTRNEISHSIGTSYCFNMNKDLNTFNEGVGDITTHAVGISYSLGLRNGLSTSLSYNFQDSYGYETDFNSNIWGLGLSRSMLKDRNLSLSADVSVSLHNYAEQRSLSYGLSARAGYSLRKVHQLGLSAGVNKYNDFYLMSQSNYAGYDLRVSLNYTYTFTLVDLKRQLEGEPKKSLKTRLKEGVKL